MEPDADPGLELLSAPDVPDGAARTFDRILLGIARARTSIRVHMFVWRADAIGTSVANALLEAADRGVRVHIRKDLGALLYERLEMNRKPLFPGRTGFGERISLFLIGRTFPDTFVRDAYDAVPGERLLAHGQVTVEWVEHTHTKYWVFDESVLLLGSINLEDRHRGYHDYMVAIEGPGAIERFEARREDRVPLDPARPVDFLVNDPGAEPPRREIRRALLDLLGEARESVYVEMAYLGDPEMTWALAAAARRGVEVTVLLSRRANVGNDLNYHVGRQLFREKGVTVLLSDTMLHSKMMFFDGKVAVLGSANLSVFSMEKAGEIDVVVRDRPGFLAALERTARSRRDAGVPVTALDQLSAYSRLLALGQQLHQRLG